MWDKHPKLNRRRFGDLIALWQAEYGDIDRVRVRAAYYVDLEVYVGPVMKDVRDNETYEFFSGMFNLCEETPPRKARIVADILAEDLRRRINEMEENS